MRKIGAWTLSLCVATALVVTATGCGQQQKAQEMVRGANPNVQKGNAQVEILRDVWVRLNKLPDNPTGYKQGVQLANKGTKAAKTAEAEYKKAKETIAGAKKLDVSDDYRSYLSMKEKALDARVQGLALSVDRFTQISKLYTAATKRDIKAWKAASTRVKAISAKIAKVPDSDKLDADANTFAKKKGIGG